MTHGTLTAYNYHRCRCSKCVEARSLYRRRLHMHGIKRALPEIRSSFVVSTWFGIYAL